MTRKALYGTMFLMTIVLDTVITVAFWEHELNPVVIRLGLERWILVKASLGTVLVGLYFIVDEPVTRIQELSDRVTDGLVLCILVFYTVFGPGGNVVVLLT